MWYATIQAMLGKVYVLSLFFTLYAHTPFLAPPVARRSNDYVSLTALGTETTAWNSLMSLL
jgi:hypothetical protein